MRTVTTVDSPMKAKMVSVFVAALIAVLIAPQVVAEQPFEMTTGGMQYKTLVEGEGAPAAMGQLVRIHFVGWLAEAGQKGPALFNSRRDKGLISYVLGTDKMLPAFNEGVVGMKPGGRRLLMVPPVFAYGERGVDDAVPPNASLILLVDLVSVGSD